MSTPITKVTQPTPIEEPEEYIRDAPKPQEEMQLTTPTKEENTSDSSDSDSTSNQTLSEVGSGYERDNNECAEFCIEFASCFGLFDSCCPSDGEGCLTSTATFCGNILFSCCKC
ncbi:hypothetical protein CAAN1_02S08438 [[Candida] anglica]|uniref:Uncharacterized protein n=1 Tax=[Candida] anglica TaxID=148631 RepID=A0ABP0EBW6_9ASCO